MKNIRLIIFDWDDVFTLGSTKGYFACYHQTLKELGVHLNKKEEERRIKSKWSQPHRLELAALLKERPLLLDRACQIYEKQLFGRTFLKHLRLVKGSVNLLTGFKHKYVLAVATGIHPNIFKQVLKKFKIPNVFSDLQFAYNIKDPSKQKPNPFMINKILRKQRIKNGEAIYIGDAKSDVEMARRAGVTPVVVLTGHLNKKEAQLLEVDYILKDVTYLKNILG